MFQTDLSSRTSGPQPCAVEEVENELDDEGHWDNESWSLKRAHSPAEEDLLSTPDSVKRMRLVLQNEASEDVQFNTQPYPSTILPAHLPPPLQLPPSIVECRSAQSASADCEEETYRRAGVLSEEGGVRAFVKHLKSRNGTEKITGRSSPSQSSQHSS